MLRAAKRRKISSSSSRAPRRKLPYRARRVSRARYGSRKLGIATGYTFSRYLNYQPTSNFSINQGTYTLATSLLAPNAGQPYFAFSQIFTVGSMPNISEFENLFDRYRINKVVITFKLSSNPDNGDVANAFYPSIWYFTDYDDMATITLPAIREVQGVKRRVLQPNKEVKIVCRPKPLAAVYNDTLTTAYSVPRGRAPWIDLANINVPHYGLKAVFDMEGITTTGTLPLIKMNVRMFASFKGVR